MPAFRITRWVARLPPEFYRPHVDYGGATLVRTRPLMDIIEKDMVAHGCNVKWLDSRAGYRNITVDDDKGVVTFTASPFPYHYEGVYY